MNTKAIKDLLYPVLLATLQDYEGLTPSVRHPLSIGSNDNAFSLRHFGKGIPPHQLVQDLFPEEVDLAPLGDFICRYGIRGILSAPKLKINSFYHRSNTVVIFENGKLVNCHISYDVAPDGILIHAEWDGKESTVAPITGHDLAAALHQLIPAANLMAHLNINFNSHPFLY